MKEEIERALQPLIGEPLSDMVFSADSQVFEFGVQRPYKDHKGQDISWADWMLDVSCYWRIVGPHGDILSSDDLDPDNIVGDEGVQNLYALLADAAPIVTGIEADEHGGLCVRLSGGYVLKVRRDENNEGSDGEQWRFLPKDEDESDLIVTAHSIRQGY